MSPSTAGLVLTRMLARSDWPWKFHSSRAVRAGQAEHLALLGHHEHALAGGRRRGAHRRAEVLFPELLAALGIERHDQPEPGRRVDAPAIRRQAAAEAFLVLLVGRRGGRLPHDRAARGAEGRHLARGVERVHPAVVDDGAGGQLAVEAGARADVGAPRRFDAAVQREMARCVGRRAAGLAPRVVRLGLRQRRSACWQQPDPR